MNPAAKSGLCLNDGTDVVMLMKLAESSGLLSKEHFAFIYPEETFLVLRALADTDFTHRNMQHLTR